MIFSIHYLKKEEKRVKRKKNASPLFYWKMGNDNAMTQLYRSKMRNITTPKTSQATGCLQDNSSQTTLPNKDCHLKPCPVRIYVCPFTPIAMWTKKRTYGIYLVVHSSPELFSTISIMLPTKNSKFMGFHTFSNQCPV